MLFWKMLEKLKFRFFRSTDFSLFIGFQFLVDDADNNSSDHILRTRTLELRRFVLCRFVRTSTRTHVSRFFVILICRFCVHRSSFTMFSKFHDCQSQSTDRVCLLFNQTRTNLCPNVPLHQLAKIKVLITLSVVISYKVIQTKISSVFLTKKNSKIFSFLNPFSFLFFDF